ncbi:MAG: class I SAM-dependent methyltransferase [Desulfomonile tiedjei]|nr:class I SAM-dependent methyltransferase [Desulfomonile tiedjei]
MDSTLEYFDYQAPLYDVYQSRCVPKYEEMVTVATEFLTYAHAQSPAVKILDVGCGTGNTTRALAKLFPKARFACVDGSKKMIGISREKLADLPVEFHHFDIETGGWDRTWSAQTFDAVISVLVLEHLPFQAYRRFLDDVQKVMKPGAWLVAVEGYGGAINQRVYFEKMARLEQEAVAAGVLTRDQLDEMKQISAEKESHFYSEPEEKRIWWLESGLTEVCIIWQYYCVAAMVGRKPT